MAIDPELIDKLLADYKKPEQIIGKDGLLKQLTKALLERALQGELTDHLGYEKERPGRKQQRELAERKDEEDAEGGLRRH